MGVSTTRSATFFINEPNILEVLSHVPTVIPSVRGISARCLSLSFHSETSESVSVGSIGVGSGSKGVFRGEWSAFSVPFVRGFVRGLFEVCSQNTPFSRIVLEQFSNKGRTNWSCVNGVMCQFVNVSMCQWGNVSMSQ
jgi:hypothetical protein